MLDTKTGLVRPILAVSDQLIAAAHILPSPIVATAHHENKGLKSIKWSSQIVARAKVIVPTGINQ